MKHHSIITVPILLKLLAVKISTKPHTMKRKPSLVGPQISIYFSKENVGHPSLDSIVALHLENFGSAKDTTLISVSSYSHT